MGNIVVSALIEGGKASAAPPLGPQLGPTGLNIGEVIAKINEITKDFAGMQVPVKVIADPATKKFEIEVGTPPVSGLVKKELGLKEPVKEEAGVKGKKTIGSLSMAQLKKIASIKMSNSLAKGLKNIAKEVCGTCLSMGVKIEGRDAREVQKMIEEGKFDAVLAG